MTHAAHSRAARPPLVVEVVAGIAREASGPSYSVPMLCRAVAATGARVELHVTQGEPDGKALAFPAHWHRPAQVLGSLLAVAPGLRDALAHAAAEAAVIHNHGLWLMPNLYPEWAVRGTKCVLVVSPRGTLSPVARARSRNRKDVMWALGQRQAVVRADCLHATSEAELADVRRAGFRQPVAVIPNGFDLPAMGDHDVERATPRRLLYLGRIHPIKGLDDLILAWNSIAAHREGWELHLVGPGEDAHVAAVQSLMEQTRARGVVLRGAAYGLEKGLEYRRASVFVLPSRSENFGMTVAEALAHGVPAIVSKGAPWKGLGERRCGWWVDHGVEPMAAALREAIELSDSARAAAGARGREWIGQAFEWSAIGQRMRAVYDWLSGDGMKPECVQM